MSDKTPSGAAPSVADQEAQQMLTQSPAHGEAPETAAEPAPVRDIALEEADKKRRSRIAGFASSLISLAILVVVAVRLLDLNPKGLIEMVPRSAPFWIVFVINYMMPPLSEWVIYRRLWRIPAAGIPALLRKQVSNELLMSYLGEVQFYAWARARLGMVTAPFGAIKDMAILSALTGNIATLVMLGAAWKIIQSGVMGKDTTTVFTSLGVVLVTSFVILLFRQKLFSLPRRELWIITGVHFLRIIAYVGLTALMWHLVLPEVAYGIWLVLATLRMLISRLPLVPYKDAAFSGLAIFLMGHDDQISYLLAMMAVLYPIAHIIVGTVFATVDLITSRKEG
ncbi:hypothetical protein [Novosphingobium humi]|uniref:hypothetical protein n=1 Tax=Novosphingobium humi TaxID=2282397 RepID=UPI0025AFB17F|nr:hypothetical protein [Novosphingobium humi]WJS99359.1 hypothetical protein NYQ05_04190 [Novosphingobium humi]